MGKWITHLCQCRYRLFFSTTVLHCFEEWRFYKAFCKTIELIHHQFHGYMDIGSDNMTDGRSKHQSFSRWNRRAVWMTRSLQHGIVTASYHSHSHPSLTIEISTFMLFPVFWLRFVIRWCFEEILKSLFETSPETTLNWLSAVCAFWGLTRVDRSPFCELSW